jgi:hypothetical protein
VISDIKILIIQVGAINYPPFVRIPEDNTTKYLEKEADINSIDGIEFRLLSHLAGKFYFQPKIFWKKDDELWGMIYDNGSSDGILGSIVEEHLQIGIGGFNWDLRYSGSLEKIPKILIKNVNLV